MNVDDDKVVFVPCCLAKNMYRLLFLPLSCSCCLLIHFTLPLLTYYTTWTVNAEEISFCSFLPAINFLLTSFFSLVHTALHRVVDSLSLSPSLSIHIYKTTRSQIHRCTHIKSSFFIESQKNKRTDILEFNNNQWLTVECSGVLTECFIWESLFLFFSYWFSLFGLLACFSCSLCRSSSSSRCFPYKCSYVVTLQLFISSHNCV